MKPIFTAAIKNPNDMELLKKYFGAQAFAHGKGHQEILENATYARSIQEYQAELQEILLREAAIRRQTREPEPPKITGYQLSFF